LTVLQAVALSIWHADLGQIVGVFAGTGWVLAIGGAMIYLFVLRPGLQREAERG
jgi:hypothetical protein